MVEQGARVPARAGRGGVPATGRNAGHDAAGDVQRLSVQFGDAGHDVPHSACVISSDAIRSAIMMVGRWVLADGMSGMTDASATHQAADAVDTARLRPRRPRPRGRNPWHRCRRGGGRSMCCGGSTGGVGGGLRRRCLVPGPVPPRRTVPRWGRFQPVPGSGSGRRRAGRGRGARGSIPDRCAGRRGTGRPNAAAPSRGRQAWSSATPMKNVPWSPSPNGPPAMYCRSGGPSPAASVLCAVAITWNSGAGRTWRGYPKSRDTAGWSARLAPTPGRSATTGMPRSRRCPAGADARPQQQRRRAVRAGAHNDPGSPDLAARGQPHRGHLVPLDQQAADFGAAAHRKGRP